MENNICGALVLKMFLPDTHVPFVSQKSLCVHDQLYCIPYQLTLLHYTM